jgi:hypothetical protein
MRVRPLAPPWKPRSRFGCCLRHCGHGSPLPVAVGYRGPARWLALYVNSDHVFYNDGAGSQGVSPFRNACR